jgi:hypothetical protein
MKNVCGEHTHEVGDLEGRKWHPFKIDGMGIPGSLTCGQFLPEKNELLFVEPLCPSLTIH